MSIHPEINSLIRKRDQAFDALYTKYQPKKALSLMEGILRELEEKHRPTTLINQIRNEREKLRKVSNKKQYRSRISQNIHLYSDWLQQVNDILWGNEYLYNKRYGAPKIEKDERVFG